jgi:cytochrome c oxidase assembly factor 1
VLNQLHRRIYTSIWVKGTKGEGLIRFKSVRKTRMGFVSWDDGAILTGNWTGISLSEAEGKDPFHQETADKIAVIE